MAVKCLCSQTAPTKPFVAEGPVDYVQCSGCGLIFRQHPETVVYDDSYFDPTRFDLWAHIQEKLIPKRLDQIASLFPNAATITVLEVGGGRGSLLPHLATRGWQYAVVEPSLTARTYIERTFSIPVFSNLTDVPEKSFDVIHLNHVLEHIINPVQALQTMRARLKCGGWIWIEVPQELMSFRLLRFMGLITGRRGLAETCFDPAHAVLYTKATLRQVLLAAGFSHVRIMWQGWSNPTRFTAFYDTLSPRNRAFAWLCRFTKLDWLLDGGWLIATATNP